VALVVAPSDFAVAFLSPESFAADGSVLLIDAPGDPRPVRLPELWTRVPPADALAHLAAALGGKRTSTVDRAWAEIWPIEAPPETSVDDDPDGVQPLAVAEALREMLQPDDVVVLDGGEFCQWVRLGLRDIANPLFWNGKLGAIGGGIPMAIGAALARPAARTFVVMGDGSAGYHLSEFETAARYGVPIVGIIGNDARWAAEWHIQTTRYGPERAFETTLLPARYDVAARGFGATGRLIEDRRSLVAALHEAVDCDDPTCLNVRVQSLRSPAVVND
jgi:acetolactate synthase-1/2/3 large subunit